MKPFVVYRFHTVVSGLSEKINSLYVIKFKLDVLKLEKRGKCLALVVENAYSADGIYFLGKCSLPDIFIIKTDKSLLE